MKFVVLKVEDVLKATSASEGVVLEGITRKIESLRKKEGRNTDPKYYVVNQDEPYAEEVLNIIKKHEGEI
ncbi:hypothetical protein ABR778_21450 [Bacillus cereus]|uniref:hypothetical protein n=1 Tax=Bacillus cereus TaxID=1396 RepID=UPI003558E78B